MWYLTSIRAGFEPWSGGIVARFDSFSVLVNGLQRLCPTAYPDRPSRLPAAKVVTRGADLPKRGIRRERLQVGCVGRGTLYRVLDDELLEAAAGQGKRRSNRSVSAVRLGASRVGGPDLAEESS